MENFAGNRDPETDDDDGKTLSHPFRSLIYPLLSSCLSLFFHRIEAMLTRCILSLVSALPLSKPSMECTRITFRHCPANPFALHPRIGSSMASMEVLAWPSRQQSASDAVYQWTVNMKGVVAGNCICLYHDKKAPRNLAYYRRRLVQKRNEAHCSVGQSQQSGAERMPVLVT
jgi:hypothetical protein